MPLFEKGQPGGPGRPPGINKVTAILQSLKIEPITELIKIALNPGTTDRLRAEIFHNLMPYVHPRLKQVSVTDADGNSLIPTMIRVITPDKKEDDQ